VAVCRSHPTRTIVHIKTSRKLQSRCVFMSVVFHVHLAITLIIQNIWFAEWVHGSLFPTAHLRPRDISYQ
jgi:hypothetical protein